MTDENNGTAAAADAIDDEDCNFELDEYGGWTVGMCEFWMEGIMVTVTGECVIRIIRNLNLGLTFPH